MGKYIA